MKKFLSLFLCVGLFVGAASGQGTKPGSSTSKPSTTPSSKYGSGTKPTPKVDPPSSKYGSGTPKPDTGSKPDTKTETKKYGSGTNTPPSSTTGEKPKTPSGYDSKAAQAQKKEESKAAFQKGTAPAPTYTDAKGKTQTIDPKDKKIESLRNQLNYEKLQNREHRQREFYTTYYSRPVVVYHDPYSSFFWWWMLDRSIEQQAMWAYHHRYDMDSARYNDMLARNAELAARVRALEAQNTPRNVAYTPTGMSDSDLMYSDQYVKAVYNPTPTPVPAQPTVAHHDNGGALQVLLYIFLGLGIVALVVWLVFVKKWE